MRRRSVTRAELEDAVLLEEERRETLRNVMQKALQQRNREINSKKRQTSPYDQQFMREALEFAREAARAGEVPVGCVIVKDGAIIGVGRNRSIEDNDPSAHAALLKIMTRARTLKLLRFVRRLKLWKTTVCQAARFM